MSVRPHPRHCSEPWILSTSPRWRSRRWRRRSVSFWGTWRAAELVPPPCPSPPDRRTRPAPPPPPPPDNTTNQLTISSTWGKVQAAALTDMTDHLSSSTNSVSLPSEHICPSYLKQLRTGPDVSPVSLLCTEASVYGQTAASIKASDSLWTSTSWCATQTQNKSIIQSQTSRRASQQQTRYKEAPVIWTPHTKTQTCGQWSEPDGLQQINRSLSHTQTHTDTHS